MTETQLNKKVAETTTRSILGGQRLLSAEININAECKTKTAVGGWKHTTFCLGEISKNYGTTSTTAFRFADSIILENGWM